MHIYVLELSVFLSRTEALSQNIFVGKYKQWYMYTSCLHDNSADKNYHFLWFWQWLRWERMKLIKKGLMILSYMYNLLLTKDVGRREKKIEKEIDCVRQLCSIKYLLLYTIFMSTECMSFVTKKDVFLFQF